MINSEESISRKFLRHVPYDEGFHFFTDIGEYTGETADGLEAFAKEIAVIGEASIKFHIQRGDFQKWIINTIGDKLLVERISQLDQQLPADNLRNEIIKIVQTRIMELTRVIITLNESIFYLKKHNDFSIISTSKAKSSLNNEKCVKGKRNGF